MRFLFVDRILQLSPGEVTRGVKHITQDDAYLYRNEEGRLCFIPSLIGETLGQLAAWNVMFTNQFRLRPVAGVVAAAKIHRPAYVNETLSLESFIECVDETAVQYHSIARVDDELVFTIEGALGPLLPMEDFIDQDLVRRQFNEINRPGEWPEAKLVMQAALAENCPDSKFNAMPMTFDAILAAEPGVSLQAVKKINRAAAYFPDHFPNKPVLPMTVLLECKLDLARQFLKHSQFVNDYQMTELRKIKMNEFIYPGDVVICHLQIKQQQNDELILHARSEVAHKRVCVVDIVMKPRVAKS